MLRLTTKIWVNIFVLCVTFLPLGDFALAQSSTALPDKPQAPDAPSKCAADCVRANMDRAAQACARPIEAQAPFDYEWMNRPFTGLFQEADSPTDSTAVVLYRGDSIRFLNGQKEWVRATYECAFDVEAGKVVSARARPGRIGQPQQLLAAARPGPAGVAKRPGAAPGLPKAASAAPGKINGQALAAAIQRAAGAQQHSAATSSKVKVGESSPILVDQVNP